MWYIRTICTIVGSDTPSHTVFVSRIITAFYANYIFLPHFLVVTLWVMPHEVFRYVGFSLRRIRLNFN